MARSIKRLIDLVVASALLVILSPVMLVVAAAIWLTSGRPVIFSQPRPGYRSRIFRVYKFRTMNHSDGVAPELRPDAERLTRLGRFLRRTSLDELPQLWNLVRGDMSLVGPRPLLIRYHPYFTERELLRQTVPPGVTGWAQIHGRNRSSWDQRLADDVWYVENWSLWLDLKILAITAKQVVFGKDVVPDARSIMLNLDEERAGRARPSADPLLQEQAR